MQKPMLKAIRSAPMALDCRWAIAAIDTSLPGKRLQTWAMSVRGWFDNWWTTFDAAATATSDFSGWGYCGNHPREITGGEPR